MAAASNYLENMIINSVLRGQPFIASTDVFVALHTGDPSETGANEVSTTDWPSYTRMDSKQGDTIDNAWLAPDNGVSKNTKQMIFPVYNGVGTLTITHFSLYDAATGGNMLVGAPLDTARSIQTGDVFVVDIEKLTVQVL